MLRWLALAALVAAGCVSMADAQQYDPSKDFNTLSAAGNTSPWGIWSDGTTMWVADLNDDKIYAYRMSDMSRDSSKDITLAAGNNDPTGIWSDGTTMWVADSILQNTGDKIYAYSISSKSHVSTKDFDTLSAAGNNSPAGIWSDGTTMWVADEFDDKIYAYSMSNKMRDSTKDFDADHVNAAGIWSDRTTMWAADFHISPGGTHSVKISAYRMSDESRDNAKNFGTLVAAGNANPTGMWSDGTTMWVADSIDNKIYAYRMPGVPATPPPPPPSTPSTPPPPSTPSTPPPPSTPSTPPPTSTPSTPTGLLSFFLPPPSDTTPPTVVSVERTGNATTTDRALTWNVTFSEPVVIRADAHINYTSVANAPIPDLGAVHDTMLVNVPGAVTGGSISVDLDHRIASGLLIELAAPDCTRLVLHNQTTAFPHNLRQPRDLGDLAGVGAAGQWTLHVSDHAKYWNGTLNAWSLNLESDGTVEGSGDTYAITRHVAGPGNYTLSLDGYDIRDRAGNHLADADTVAGEPYHVVGAAARTCQTE